MLNQRHGSWRGWTKRSFVFNGFQPTTPNLTRGLRYSPRALCRSVAPVLASGPRCFDATAQAGGTAWAYVWINATIPPPDNDGRQLTYLPKRGFRDWHFDQGVTLASGQIVEDQQTVRV